MAENKVNNDKEIITKKACVIGGNGFVASLLVKLLLEKDYVVNATVQNPDDKNKISHLIALQDLGELNIFKANLSDEASFNAAIQGSHIVFLVATPIIFDSEDPENDMIKPAVQGVTNVLRACTKASSVKRVIITSSAAAVTINSRTRNCLVMTENDWTDVDFLYSEKPPTWGYSASKTLAEKAAWKFAQENNLDLITVIPTLMTGTSLTPDIPSSISLATCLITGNEFLIDGLKSMQMVAGSISIAHVEDVCRAHVFLAEKESASGRYLCNAVNTSVPELSKFLCKRYPHYTVSTEFGEFPSKAKAIVSSEKLVKEGFEFKYGMEEIYDQTLEYLKVKNILKN